MSDNTAIEWATATWNFLVGCTKVSAGCTNCYAIRSVARMSGNPQFGERYQGLVTVGQKPLNWTGKLTLIHHAQYKPFHWTAPRRIFVNSLSDLFHEDVHETVIAETFAIMAMAKQHTYQILTKRPDRMAAVLNDPRFPDLVDGFMRQWAERIERPCVDEMDAWPLPNVWLGTSVEDQRAADERIPHLLATPAAVRFLSCEPLLGAVTLPFDNISNLPPLAGTEWLQPPTTSSGWYSINDFEQGLHWVITGGESGPKARPMDPSWARSLRDQCHAAGVAFFHKQNGEYVEIGTNRLALAGNGFSIPTGERLVGQTKAYGFSDGPIVQRVGKKKAGRLLDGVEHSAFPEPARVLAAV